MNTILTSGLCGILIGGVWGWTERKPVNSPLPLTVASREKVAVTSPHAPPPRPASPGPGGEMLQWLERIALASREDLLDLSRGLFAGKPDFYATGLLWERWVELDPEGGFRALLDGEIVKENRMLQVWTYLGKWSARDPDTAIAKTLTLPEDNDRQVALDRISRTLAASRPADFFRCYEELSKRANITYALKAAAVQMALQDPRRLAGQLDGSIAGLSMEETEKSKARQGLASGWARNDPQAALAYFRRLENGEDRSLALGEIAKRVIVKNPDLAAEIILEAKGKTTLKEAAAALALTDLDGALAWLKKHFPTDTTKVAAEVARDHIPRTSLAAVDYLTRHADVLFGESKPPADPFSRWTVDDPQAALALADKISNPDTRLQVRLLFLDSMALCAPAEAIAQAAPGQERNRILNQAVETWARHDLTAASAWLAAEPAGAERDRAIGGLLNVTLRVEPESALPWAAAISDQEDRINNLARVLSRTNQRSAEAVTTALQDFVSAPEEITKIMTAIQNDYPPR